MSDRKRPRPQEPDPEYQHLESREEKAQREWDEMWAQTQSWVIGSALGINHE